MGRETIQASDVHLTAEDQITIKLILLRRQILSSTAPYNEKGKEDLVEGARH